MNRSPDAAAIVVGNEILSGKVREANVYELARVLRSAGVLLSRVVIIPDDVEIIARDVRSLRTELDYVFTSGGVGVTHDDVTIAGVARAFGVPVVRDPELEALIRAHYVDRVHENHLALANVPKGARKILADRYPWPLLAMDNVFVLPGIPEIFQRKLAILREHLKTAGGPFVSRAAYTRMDEAVLKPLLDSVVARNPEVEVGSYPRWNDPKYDTKLTFDGKNVEAVERAFAEFLELLPPGEPQWIE